MATSDTVTKRKLRQQVKDLLGADAGDKAATFSSLFADESKSAELMTKLHLVKAKIESQ